MQYTIHLLLFSFAFTTPVIAAEPAPAISLSYGKFSGGYSSSYNITYYRKIPFGASTAGVNRFRAPQPPANITDGVYNTDKSFDSCPHSDKDGSEDCLYLGVYSRPWANGAKRPVVVSFYGGGFIRGGATFGIPPAGYPILNVSDLNDFVFVYPNYRTNAFGFLPGKAVKEATDTDLNAGLLDQQFALRWVHANIEEFGGDPRNVSIWGMLIASHLCNSY